MIAVGGRGGGQNYQPTSVLKTGLIPEKRGSNTIYHECRVHDGHFKKKIRSLAPRVLILWQLDKFGSKSIQVSICIFISSLILTKYSDKRVQNCNATFSKIDF